MSDDPLRTLSLGSAWKEIVYTASCKDCNHWTRIDLKRLAAELGEQFPLHRLRARLKCSNCGGKRIIIATVDKSTTAATTALARWPFDYD